MAIAFPRRMRPLLYESADINGIGAIANIVRERKNGNVATYIHNRYINYSNVCLLSCQFCAFGAKKREAHAFEMAIPEIVGNCSRRVAARHHRDSHGGRAAPDTKG